MLNFRKEVAPLLGGTLLLITACSSSTPTTTEAGADMAQLDAAADSGASEAVADLSFDTADLAIDAKAIPAHWKLVSGKGPEIEDHTATLLDDGRVLIVGGEQIQTGANHVEQKGAYLYLPDKNTIVSAKDLSVDRTDHAALRLDDGRVLVTGGKSDGGYLKSTELFDPKTDTWSNGPAMFRSRWGHAMTKLQGGNVLITGGFTSSDSTDTVVLYDVKSGKFRAPAATMKVPRRFHTATLLKNGKVLIAGGIRGSKWSNYEWLDTMEIYDPKAGTFSLLAVKMSKRRTGHTATLLKSGKVFIVGGFCGAKCQGGKLVNDLYDPLLDKIAPVAHIGGWPIGFTTALLDDGRVIVISSEADRKKVVAYSPSGGGFWDVLPSLLEPASRVTATKLKDGSVVCVGGVKSTATPYTYTGKAQRFYP